MDLKNVTGVSKVAVSYIGETVQPDPAKTFLKREIGFTVYETINGNEYERTICMQCTGATDKPQFDKTKMLDNWNIGDVVDVTYSISGSTKKNEKLQPTAKNPGCLSGFNNLTVSRIERFAMVQQQPQYAPAGYQPQMQQGGYMPQTNVPAANQTGPISYPQPVGEPPMGANGPKVWNTNTGQWEELPF